MGLLLRGCSKRGGVRFSGAGGAHEACAGESVRACTLLAPPAAARHCSLLLRAAAVLQPACSGLQSSRIATSGCGGSVCSSLTPPAAHASPPPHLLHACVVARARAAHQHQPVDREQRDDGDAHVPVRGWRGGRGVRAGPSSEQRARGALHREADVCGACYGAPCRRPHALRDTQLNSRRHAALLAAERLGRGAGDRQQALRLHARPNGAHTAHHGATSCCLTRLEPPAGVAVGTGTQLRRRARSDSCQRSCRGLLGSNITRPQRGEQGRGGGAASGARRPSARSRRAARGWIPGSANAAVARGLAQRA